MKYLIIILLFSNSLWSQNTDEHKWNNRVLIIRGSKTDSILVEQQFKTFSKIQNQITDRKLVLYKCIENNCTFYDWKQKPRILKMEALQSSFEIILIGLDGYEKFKSSKLEESKVIFDLIDQMPMRRQEIKNHKK